MKNILPVVVEILIFFGFYVAALIVAWPLRRRLRQTDTNVRGVGVSLKRVLLSLSLPAAVLVVSQLVWWLLLYGRLDESLLARGEPHMGAWLTFWGFVLVLTLVERGAIEIYGLMNRLFPVPDLMRNILRGLLLVAAVFGILKYQLHIEISPLLASTALVTAVVGFALQGVLGNLLAGMSMHVVRSVVPSDWVQIGDVEGEVIQTNWRETRLRTVGGHMMIVPNSVVASSTIHNMTRPTPLRRHRVDVGASYSDAPGDVIDALVESALEVQEVLRDPAPSAVVTEYKDFGINYRLRFWTNTYHDRAVVEGNVMRMIWYKFKRRGIEIPFPMSDKLLNDFMAVVYRQRTMPPEEIDIERTLADLLRSDVVSKWLVDEKGVPLLKEEDLRGVAKSVKRVRFTKGETVFCQGQPGTTCYVVVWGRVHGHVEYKDAGRMNEFELNPGALFGEMSLVTGLPRTATITAREEVELLEVSEGTFRKILSLRQDIPEILSRLVAQRSEQNAAAYEKLKEMAGTNVAETIRRENILKRFLRMLGR